MTPTALATFSNVTFDCARSDTIASSIAAPTTTCLIWPSARRRSSADCLGTDGAARPSPWPAPARKRAVPLRLLGPAQTKQRAAEGIPRVEQPGIEHHGAAQHATACSSRPAAASTLTEHAERSGVRRIDQCSNEIFDQRVVELVLRAIDLTEIEVRVAIWARSGTRCR